MQLKNPADFLDFLTKTQLHDVIENDMNIFSNMNKNTNAIRYFYHELLTCR